MKKILIGGVGNLLLGDAGVGPYVMHLLEHHYHFQEGVRVRDLGVPGSDLAAHLCGIDALIVVDTISSDAPAGTVSLYRREDIVRHGPALGRSDASWLSLPGSLSIAAVASEGPREVLLIGITGERFEPGFPLSPSVRKAALHAVEEVLLELDRLDADYAPRAGAAISSAWWEALSDPVPV